MRRLSVAAALVAGLWASTAHGFHGTDFVTSANEGGGSRMYFTGSPRYKNYDCTVCHVGAPGSVSVELASDSPDLLAGSYTPGAMYAIEVTMVHATLGDTSRPNGYDFNGFVAEVIDDGGRLVGNYDTPNPASVYTMDRAGGDPRVVAGRADKGETEWTVHFRAPEAGAGRLSLYLAAVDGNAANGGVETPVDPLGDDVFAGKWRFCEKSSSCTRSFDNTSYEDAKYAAASPAGCAIAAAYQKPRGELAIWGLGVFAVFACRRRSWKRRAAAVAILPVLGCAESAPWPPCRGGVDCEYDVSREPTGDSPALDIEAFRCDAQPVLMARCSFYPCHGDPNRPLVVYAPGRLRWDAVPAGTQQAGQTEAELGANYQAAIKFALGAEPSRSLLVRKPLDVRAGGVYHFGESIYEAGDVFDSTDDPGYQRLLAWLFGGTRPAGCRPDFENVGSVSQ